MAVRAIRSLGAERWLLVATLVGLVHHADHVLRFDHSGWPFREEVSPFTYSLAVYPVVVAILLLDGRPRARAGLAVLLFLFPTLAHTTIETPATQYRTWCSPEVNLLGVDAPAVGVLAGTVTVLLSLTTLMAFLAFLDEARLGSRRVSR